MRACELRFSECPEGPGTLIDNRQGSSETIGKGENKKKNNTKLTILCDDNKVIYDIQYYGGNVADVKTVIPAFKIKKFNLDDVDCGANKFKNFLKFKKIKSLQQSIILTLPDIKIILILSFS